MQQLPLNLKLPTGQRFENFLAGPNAAAVEELQRSLHVRPDPWILLCGNSATGKSHLLVAWCAAARSSGVGSVYVDLARAEQLDPALLGNLEKYECVAIDHLQRVLGQPGWDVGLFNFLNLVRAGSTKLVLSMRDTPARTKSSLPDLDSRLRWGTTLALRALSDDEKKMVLQRRAAVQGIELNSKVLDYLLTRSGRDLGGLVATLEKLAEASLADQRRITLPYLRKWMMDQQ